MPNRLRILHVEDSADDAELIQRALRASTFQCETHRVETEADYLAQLREWHPELILCDYDLPKFSAERALHLRGELGLDVPFIVVSNHIGQTDAVIAMQRGASDYLSKSDLGRLPQAVEGAIDRTRALREKAAAEMALRRSETTLRSILDSLDDRIALLDGDGTVLAANKSWQAFDSQRLSLGMSALEPGANYLGWLAECVRRDDATAGELREGIVQVMERRESRFALRYELRLAATQGWYLARVFPVEGTERGVVVSHRDITDSMMSRIAIENGHRQLQELSRRVLQIQEEERRAISSELHDDIGQSLGALKIALHRMARDPGADHGELLGESLATADATLEKLRHVALELRPPQLDQLGLGAALEWLAERQQKATGLAIECRSSGLERRRAPPAIESACYRIAQESMNNAARHAKASAIHVSIDCDGQLLKLAVRDDGVGFDAESARSRASKGGSLGLIGMEERARLAGGRLKVRTVHGAGTTVTAIFPLDAHAVPSGGDELDSRAVRA